MIARPIFEKFRQDFLAYFNGDVISAEFDNWQQLIVFVNPYLDFAELVMHICESILEIVYFRQHLELHIYPFGNNEAVRISIN